MSKNDCMYDIKAVLDNNLNNISSNMSKAANILEEIGTANYQVMPKPYKKEYDYSYTLGAFPTIEMIKARPENVRIIYMHSTFTEKEMLIELCTMHGIIWDVNDKTINRLSKKENVFVVGIFTKYNYPICTNKPHVVLVNPSDMGNLGTIIRTAVGFGIKDIAIINPGADIFNPKAIRASMGAVFKLNHEYYDSFDCYMKAHEKHEVFTFMLNGEKCLSVDKIDKPELISLVFGNEASGLDDSFYNVGTSIRIKQTGDVDSLNLTVAAGIGMYMFMMSN